MLYTIVNPSDPYTIEANSLDVAAVACVLLGRGQYAFEPLVNGGEEIPFLMFGGVDEWFMKHFGRDCGDTFDEVMDQKKEELAACLDSCLIGNTGERELFFDAIKPITDPQERHEYWLKYHDKRLSSFNDIGGRAKAIAKRLREPTAPSPDPCPQQVFGVRDE